MTNRFINVGKNDLTYKYEQELAKKRINALKELSRQEKLKISDILEMKELTQSTVLNKEDKKIFNKQINLWFQNTLTKNLINELDSSKFPIKYNENLWKIIAQSKFIKKEQVEKILPSFKCQLQFPILESKIAKQHQNSIIYLLMSDPSNISLLVGPRAISPEIIKKNLPDFSDNQKQKLAKQFVEISQIQDVTLLQNIYFDKTINNNVRQKAEQKYEQFMTSNQNSIKFEDEDHVLIKPNEGFGLFSGDKNSLTLNKRILDKYQSPLDIVLIIRNILMGNLGILNLSKKNEMDLPLLQLLKTHPKMPNSNFFNKPSYLDKAEVILQSVFYAYYLYLKNSGIHLEKIFEWFFSTFIKNKFGIEGLNINLDINDTDYGIKALNASTQIHRICRMYNLFTMKNDFDRRLIDSFSETCRFNEIGSVLDKKEFTITSPELKAAERIIFSNQSPLNFKQVLATSKENIGE